MFSFSFFLAVSTYVNLGNVAFSLHFKYSKGSWFDQYVFCKHAYYVHAVNEIYHLHKRQLHHILHI